MGILEWADIWIYLLANVLGGAAAAGLFMYTQPAEKGHGDERAAEPADRDGDRERARAARRRARD